jgi:hypothetical protein
LEVLLRVSIFLGLLVSFPSFGHDGKSQVNPERPSAENLDEPDSKLCWEAKKVVGLENVRKMAEAVLASYSKVPGPLLAAIEKMRDSFSQSPSAIANRQMSDDERQKFERWPRGYPSDLPAKSNHIERNGDSCYSQTVDLWNKQCHKRFSGVPESIKELEKLSEVKRHRLEDGDFSQNLESMAIDPMDESNFEAMVENNPKSNEEKDPHWFYTYRYEREAKFPQEIRDFRKKLDQVDAWYELVQRGKITIVGNKYKPRGSTKTLTDLQKERLKVTGKDDDIKNRIWLEYKISEIAKLVKRLGASPSIVNWYREVDESGLWSLAMAENIRRLDACIQTNDNANIDPQFKDAHFVSCLRKKEPAWALCQFCSPDECRAAKNWLSFHNGEAAGLVMKSE